MTDKQNVARIEPPVDAFGTDYLGTIVMMAVDDLLKRPDDELRELALDMELTASALTARVEKLRRANV